MTAAINLVRELTHISDNPNGVTHSDLDKILTSLNGIADKASHLNSPHLQAVNNAIGGGKNGAIALGTHLNTIKPHSPQTQQIDKLNAEHNTNVFWPNQQPKQSNFMGDQAPAMTHQENQADQKEAHISAFGPNTEGSSKDKTDDSQTLD